MYTPLSDRESSCESGKGSDRIKLIDLGRSDSSRSSSLPSLLSVDTPPTEGEDNDDVQIAVSTTFHPAAVQSFPPDLVLCSTDSVFFYVHSTILLQASANAFASVFPVPLPAHLKDPYVALISETSTVLNIMLHTIYDMSCAHYSPSFDDVARALTTLPVYGLDIKSRVLPSTPLFEILSSHAPFRPLDLYILASSHDLYALAALASSHLLSLKLWTITDEDATRIGPMYLKHLFLLHVDRMKSLQRAILPLPSKHAPTPTCSLKDQDQLMRSWSHASAQLAWEARPDISTNMLESALSASEASLNCDLCKQSLRNRVDHMISQWSIAKQTI